MTTAPSRPALAGDHAHGLFQGAAQNAHAGGGIAFQLDAVQGGDGVDQRHTTAGDDAFFDGRAGGAQGVFDAVLLFLQLGLGGGADADDGHAAGQLGQAFLQLLTVVVAGAGLGLGADLVDAALDGLRCAGAADDRGVVLGADDLVAAAQVLEHDAFQLAAQFFGDDLATGQDGDVLQHGLAAVAKARGLDGQGVDHAAQLVQHQRGQRFAVHIFGDDHDLALADLDQLLQHRARCPGRC